MSLPAPQAPGGNWKDELPRVNMLAIIIQVKGESRSQNPFESAAQP